MLSHVIFYQICELEKEEILEFEGHLAAATSNVTITESNSLLLSQLISMNAKSVPNLCIISVYTPGSAYKAKSLAFCCAGHGH